MSHSLVIVESPSKAKTIGKYLGKEYEVRASVGHVRDLPERELGVDIENGFAPKYVTIKGKEKVLKELRAAAQNADRILLAPDPDREGEAIAWHIGEALKLKDKPIQRILFNEITKRAVIEALNHPTELNLDKFNSQQARRVLDRLVGYKLSPLLWQKVKRGLSAGRVQSVAVRLVVEREQEIENFKPEEYWEIFVDLAADLPPVFTAKLGTRDGKKLNIADRAAAETVCRELSAGRYTVTGLAERTQKKRAWPPFITSTLQQVASRRLRMSPANIMRIAQELYEGIDITGEGPQGLITYMRTDSVRIAAEAQAAARDYIGRVYGADYVPASPNFYQSRKGAQEAHEAIRPTSLELPPEKVKASLSPAQFKVYDLIWRRFLASQMTPAEFAVTTVQIANGPYGLSVSEHKEIFAGHLAAMRDEDEAEKEENGGPESKLPPLVKDQQLTEKQVDPQQKFTQPPARFTEATLIKELEEKGIGRPSTYAAILSTILDKDYVEKLKAADKNGAAGEAKKVRGSLRPTDLGRAVTRLLVDSFPEVLNVSFTARMEDELDEVEEGRVEWHALLADFWKTFSGTLEIAEKEMKNLKREGEKTDIVCDKCGQGVMVIKYGRNGTFLGCSNYPECRNTKNYTRDGEGRVSIVERPAMPTAEPKPSDKLCPICGGPMNEKMSRKGSRFYSCVTYPKCKGTLPFDTGVPCPREGCGGSLVERSGPRGVFWGCSKYPECRVTYRAEPVLTPCPKCSNPFLLRRRKDGQVVLSCPIRECDYEQPLEAEEPKETTEG
ncbi:MAG: type I DNA topoisomerase [Myxococcales bacterium]|nr:type I DNA topoisomerase [Myxococcales bacterium]